MLSRIEELQLQLEAILLTHAHFDHIGAVGGEEKTGAPSIAEGLYGSQKNGSGRPGMERSLPGGGPYLEGGET